MQSTMKLPGSQTIYAAAVFTLVLLGIAMAPLVCETCTQLCGTLENHWAGLVREAEKFYAVHP